MRVSIEFTLSILIVTIVFCGCLSQSVEKEISTDLVTNCEIEVSVFHDTLVGKEDTQSVVANVRSLQLNNTSQILVFTEPILGTFSILETSCGSNCSHSPFTRNGFIAPLRIDAADFDGDGNNELILSDIGVLSPSDEKYGKISILTMNESGIVDEEIVIENIGRVACSEAADLDGDQDLDLTLCEFGHTNGSVGWLENIGDGNWTWHKLEDKPGSIEAIPIDMDGDGDLDIVAVISQLSEEIVIYWNDGFGNFESEIMYKAATTFFGMSGINIVDYEDDGDKDILFTNGDVLDGDFPQDQNLSDYHGLSLLENMGGGVFDYQKLMSFIGAYDSAFFDIDGDGIDEIVVVGFMPDFSDAINYGEQSNIGWLDFDNDAWVTVFPVNNIDVPLISLEVMDLNGDGQKNLIAANHDITNTSEAPKLVSIFTSSTKVCSQT